MTCVDVLPKLSAYHDGELNPQDRGLVTGHLAECPGCNAYLRDVAGIGSLLRSDLPGEVPEGTWGRIAAAAQQIAPRSRLRAAAWFARVAGVAAGFVLYVLGYGAMTSTLEPPEEERFATTTQIEEILRETGVALARRGSIDDPLKLLDHRPEARFFREIVKDTKP